MLEGLSKETEGILSRDREKGYNKQDSLKKFNEKIIIIRLLYWDEQLNIMVINKYFINYCSE